ncbi:hypothetical protein [Ornithinimicrobium sp. INDO-MA30-4]|uniref:hypothetical protein n=1 Tax=Ornithinimicrobium sp. INDO-MA30-4 TaxID=2908651 RepID=UPI001F43C55C|nr:hypothetical protein [Ornithinimicrobium sp. INDO-MA30-4]UJH70385.1 hypothetical protein L0A91_14825 [Ornithinimicrobium sp. INDO-MA30-4]
MTALAATALVLSACSEDAPEVTAATETVTIEAPAPEEAASTTVAPEPAAESTEEPEPTTEEAAESEDDFGDSETSARGNLIKEVGQVAGIYDVDTDESIVNFKLLEVEKGVDCTSGFSDAPANGQFVAFTFEVETFPALAEDIEPFYGSFAMNSFYLTAFSDDGVLQNDIDGNSWTCLDPADELPSEIGPGQKATGKVVIDTSLQSGVLVYTPTSFGNAAGWEWEF